ncbi:hypothetical protein DFH07DRAFT_1031763 [Mycena maculata]|uniref:Rho-GAP domain-containing protein n=1 Tax=Mycena maculata TaxID=230809 RepID=A0AAD7IYK8_9AGAR|nr:hypothetical protein DFH07DRAFT_1031763 [Mycena maculata]
MAAPSTTLRATHTDSHQVPFTLVVASQLRIVGVASCASSPGDPSNISPQRTYTAIPMLCVGWCTQCDCPRPASGPEVQGYLWAGGQQAGVRAFAMQCLSTHPSSSYIPTLSELACHIPLTQIDVPPAVYQENLKYEHKITLPVTTWGEYAHLRLPLEDLMGFNSEKGGIPRVVRDTIQFIRESGVEEEGLSAEAYDRGTVVSLETFGDPHLAAMLLKKYLRDLSEPLIPPRSPRSICVWPPQALPLPSASPSTCMSTLLLALRPRGRPLPPPLRLNKCTAGFASSSRSTLPTPKCSSSHATYPTVGTVFSCGSIHIHELGSLTFMPVSASVSSRTRSRSTSIATSQPQIPPLCQLLRPPIPTSTSSSPSSSPLSSDSEFDDPPPRGKVPPLAHQVHPVYPHSNSKTSTAFCDSALAHSVAADLEQRLGAASIELYTTDAASVAPFEGSPPLKREKEFSVHSTNGWKTALERFRAARRRSMLWMISARIILVMTENSRNETRRSSLEPRDGVHTGIRRVGVGGVAEGGEVIAHQAKSE